MNKNLNQYKPVRKLFVSKTLYNFVNKELLKKTKIEPKQFWHGLDRSLYQLRLKNEKLLQTRSNIQNLINYWHINNKGKKFNFNKYKNFLLEIGYLKKKVTTLRYKLKMLTMKSQKYLGLS